MYTGATFLSRMVYVLHYINNMFSSETLLILGGILGGLGFGALLSADIWRRGDLSYALLFLISLAVCFGWPVFLFDLYPINAHVKDGGRQYQFVWIMSAGFARLMGYLILKRLEAKKIKSFERGIDIEIAERKAEMRIIDDENKTKH